MGVRGVAAATEPKSGCKLKLPKTTKEADDDEQEESRRPIL